MLVLKNETKLLLITKGVLQYFCCLLLYEISYATFSFTFILVEEMLPLFIFLLH